MKVAGLVLAICGGTLILFVLRSSTAQSPAASSSPSSSGASGGSGGSSSSSSSGSSIDSGTHSALDAAGNLYTIASSYANMTDQQKGDANTFARQNPNGIATA
jgi:hypothetical protein